MSDYYGYAPLLTLPRPLVFTGLPGAEVGMTVRAINLLTGVPFAWVTRRMAHMVGSDAQRVELETGSAAFAELARSVLAEVFARPASHLVAAPHHVLTEPKVARWLRAQEADVVVLKVAHDVALRRIEASVQDKGSNHLALRRGLPFEHGQVLATVQDLGAVLDREPVFVAVNDDPALAVAERAMEQLGLVPPA